MTASLSAGLQHLLPQRLLCSFIYKIARSNKPWIKNPLIRWFIRQYRVDMSEAQQADVTEYSHFNAFFTRALKTGARPVTEDRRSIVSPADGELTQFGTLDEGRLIQAKGMTYSIESLLDEQTAALSAFMGGRFATIYLAPHDYHRVHSPTSAELILTRYIPGRRFSVNKATAESIVGLFCRNERVVCWFDTGAGHAIVVLVGALNVSSISTAAIGEVTSGEARQWRQDRPVRYLKGAEIGRFNLGSTVILLYPKNTMAWDDALRPGDPVRMGMPIGMLTSEPEA